MEYIDLKELSKELSISLATAKNWLRLGKIVPACENVSAGKSSSPLFSKDYVRKLKKDILSGKLDLLKSRRNKKFVSGKSFYDNYLLGNSQNVGAIRTLVEKAGVISEEEIKLLLADCALKLFDNTSNLKTYINSKSSNKLIDDLIPNKSFATKFIESHLELFQTQYEYKNGEDILGLLYISLTNLGSRKLRGAYYTPVFIAKALVNDLGLYVNKTILDPCCGTGSFLIQLPDTIRISNVHGCDIDEISVKLTRLNLALKFRPDDINILYKNIVQKDFLDSELEKYDCIIGNPPWGYEYSEFEQRKLKRLFLSAKGENIESYDVFVEQSINFLNKGGLLAFVLPEAVLNVKTHKCVRKILMNGCELSSLEYLGNVFGGVNCPSIILSVKKTDEMMTCVGARIKTKNRSFVIGIEREINAELFDFSCDDEEYKILEKLCKNKMYLRGHAEFALGIVTGSNKSFIKDVKTNDNEVIIKGADVYKYRIQEGNNYIEYRPQWFQQVAPEEVYRAKEKLVYRFIGDELVFAYDNKQRLTLNSCNILIPRLRWYGIKYILAILNSTVAQFVYKKRFNSMKVLRSHIEQIPIAECDNPKDIEALVDKLIILPDDEDTYKILDKKIADLYGLSKDEYVILNRMFD